MFARMSRGWALMSESWQVLKLDKELMLFPILSAIACLLVMASFALPVIVSPELRNSFIKMAKVEQQQEQEEQREEAEERVEGFAPHHDRHHHREGQSFQFTSEQIIPAILGFLFYLATNFVIVFFNTALVCCALARFNGGSPTLGDGLNAARARLPQIFGWALLSATVGIILKQVEDRASFIGKFIVGLIGMAWAATTFMVVPILAAERLGPFAAVKRSASLLRKTWGEALVGQVSFGAVQMLFMLPAFLAIFAAGYVSAVTNTVWPIAIVGVLAALFLILCAITFSTLQQIFLAAVYQYAADGTVPTGFTPALIESAFKPKNAS